MPSKTTTKLESAGRATYESRIFKPANKSSSAQFAARKRDATRIAVLICLPFPSAKEGPAVSTPVMKPIGLIDLHPGIKQEFEHHRNADIGIQIAAEHQRKGYGSEAIKWILQWAFRHGGLHRVGIGCYSFNTGARRLYERLGFVYEGAKRESLWYDGAWHDQFTLSMLEHEWSKRLQQEKS